MGVVYEAEDTRLRRQVAVKVIRVEGQMNPSRERFWREAQAAARIRHPGICQIYEIGEEDNELFIVMELLDGEGLASRISRNLLSLDEAVDITLQILSGLESVHKQKIIHRDLKPSNVFLTPHGVKLLDFGLARAYQREADGTQADLTVEGAAVGTPRYMSPEQWGGKGLSPSSDIFAVGALLYEMLSGKRAFQGETIHEVFYSILNEQPSPLTGGPQVAAIDRVIQRALEKDPKLRYQSAKEMADALERAHKKGGDGEQRSLSTMKRLMVLPFRLLRPDEEIDFLSYSLPDAITASLSGFNSLLVRSSASALPYWESGADITTIGREAGVDAVLHGTLLRSGAQVRVMTQLVESPTGSVLCSRTAQVELKEIFQLQDDLAKEIVDSLSVPLSASLEGPLQKDVPTDSKAYELYLRANQLGTNPNLLREAEELYRACLERDPDFAPAWAQLGRVYRIFDKYEIARGGQDYFDLAKGAFDKALVINPDLSIAHNLYTYMEVETLGRAKEAMVRLLQRAHSRTFDPNLFAGLVLACRFCGLLEASVAADRRARRLDPGIRTSVQYTYWLLGEYDNAAKYDDEDLQYVANLSLTMVGREEEAITAMRAQENSHLRGLLKVHITSVRAALENNRQECLEMAQKVYSSRFRDPEGLYLRARDLSRVGEVDLSLSTLAAVVEDGFYCHRSFFEDPWFENLRNTKRFNAILERSRELYAGAHSAFLEVGGPEILDLDLN